MTTKPLQEQIEEIISKHAVNQFITTGEAARRSAKEILALLEKKDGLPRYFEDPACLGSQHTEIEELSPADCTEVIIVGKKVNELIKHLNSMRK